MLPKPALSYSIRGPLPPASEKARGPVLSRRTEDSIKTSKPGARSPLSILPPKQSYHSKCDALDFTTRSFLTPTSLSFLKTHTHYSSFFLALILFHLLHLPKMTDYQSCIDWCHSHPVLLALAILFSIAFPFFLYAASRGYFHHSTNTDHDHLLPYDEKSTNIAPRQPRRAWSSFMADLLPRRPGNEHASNSDDDIESQEKTPLLGGGENRQKRRDGWRNSGQLFINWHGTNQLNTSWGWMA